MFGWTPAQIPLFVALPFLLAASGFFSGSETTLFGLTHAERQLLRQHSGRTSRALDVLLQNPRLLLITVLLGNMTVNVLYFVASSVLLIMATETTWIEQLGLGAASLLIIIVCGEVVPKLIASLRRTTTARLIAHPLLVVHRAIAPLRSVIDILIISPLSRLAGSVNAPQLNDQELRSMLDVYGREGAIDDDEHRMLHDVLDLRRLKVRDIMTPRVRMVALESNATRDQVVQATRDSSLTTLPVFEGDLDHIVGIVHVKRYLHDEKQQSVTGKRVMTSAHFVPAMASLEQLLENLRHWRAQSAIVIDEYGGTAGIVAIEDVVEEIVGDIVFVDERAPFKPVPLGEDVWRVDGDMSVPDFCDAFDIDEPPDRAATVSGMIVNRIGRAPQQGDQVSVRGLALRVETVDDTRITTCIVQLSSAEAGHTDQPTS